MEKLKILTFDMEEWFHLIDVANLENERNWDSFEKRFNENAERIFRILEETNVEATFFCLGWIAERYPEVIRYINEKGWHIGSHSHAHRMVHKLTVEQFSEDLKRSINAIADAANIRIDCYRAPGFSLTRDTEWAFEELLAQGIKIDSSYYGGKDHTEDFI